MLYEDSDLLAIEQPSGLLVDSEAGSSAELTLIDLLHHGLNHGAEWAKRRGLRFLGSAFRLDAESSGVVLLAKSPAVLHQLADQFGAEKPHWLFKALIEGAPVEESFTVSIPLCRPSRNDGWVRASIRLGKKARTDFRVFERLRSYSMLECRPLNSRPHQIRAHLREVGLAVVGDHFYGGRLLRLSQLKSSYRAKREVPEKPLLGRPAIHAERITFLHPASGQEVSITSPLARDFSVALKYLRRYDAPANPTFKDSPVRGHHPAPRHRPPRFP